MKKNQIDAILVNQTKRRNTVIAFIGVIIVVFILALGFLMLYREKNKEYYVNYDENSKISYDVYLKENDFFENTALSENKQYISSLIDHIQAKFEYDMDMEDVDVEYRYSYRIEASVDVVEKNTNKSLYNKVDTLIERKQLVTDKNALSISEKIDVDYVHYNDLIKRFVEVYGLNNAVSTLNINMYVNMVGSCEEFDENAQKEAVISLSIPLTTNTMAIDISDNLVNTENNLMYCKEDSEYSIVLLIFSILLMIADVMLIITTVKFEIKTRTAENVYERELRKILNNYGSYIQTMNSEFDFQRYQILIIDNFNDMLEIRDTVRQPILMKENEDKTGAYFLIPSNTKILYVYRLKVSDIKKEMEK